MSLSLEQSTMPDACNLEYSWIQDVGILSFHYYN